MPKIKKKKELTPSEREILKQAQKIIFRETKIKSMLIIDLLE